MVLYAIKKDDGTLVDTCGDTVNENLERGMYFEAEPNKSKAERYARKFGGHVVELVEKPEPVMVSEEEADILKRAATDRYPASFIMGAVASNDTLYADKESEDRIMRAYVNGWTVEKPKRWNVKVPHTGAGWWYAKPDPDINHGKGCARPAFTGINNPQVRITDAEIIKYGLQDCEKVEVTDDDQ